MATPRKADDSGSPDRGQDELQERFDEAARKGYFGSSPDPNPNEAYSLQSGPDSPPAVPDHQTRAGQHQAGVKEG